MDPATSGPLFQTPPDPHYLWTVGVALAALAIGVATVGLVRGRLPATLLAPALLLPIASFGLGYLFLLEESKRVEFCGSCHLTMAPVVAALMQDNGSLSSLHARRGAVSSQVDACYRCHSGYGIWGAADAKLAGVRHMLHTVTGDFEFPLKAAPFDINSCLGCHAAAVPFRAAAPHQDPEIQKQLLAGELGCAGLCHPEAHPAAALSGAHPDPAATEAAR